MASARRTSLVTNHDRPLKCQSLLGRPANAFSPFLHGLRCLLGGVYLRKNLWGRSFFRPLLFSFIVRASYPSSTSTPPPISRHPTSFFFDPIRAPPPAEEQELLPDPFDNLFLDHSDPDVQQGLSGLPTT
ncbi:hypothetical protein B296_00042485 [Ensete ventricosum]|uniref:Uncharacterized protein n=1 Tax=Ensete ventricosum TaxID=4639 RepID=A0A426XV89_ENSVE|nr:hypothetical protein B296_00042485 [Ensete ventricosum]